MKATITLEGVTYVNMPDLIAGDVGKILSFAVKLDSDVAVDLTGATVIFKTKKLNEPNNKIEAPCVITGAGTGICEYTTLAADLDDSGVYDAEIQITIAGVINSAKLGRFVIWQDLP